MINNKDTIAAISTPPGQGGIGIVRMSGEKSIDIADKIFCSLKEKNLASCKSHTVHYGHIKERVSGEVIDEVLVTIMKAPATYTSENIVEINCHGGDIPLRRVLGSCLDQGARLADPGEFTKRAFLNGRIDLTQAEAVLDIIKSETDSAMKAAIDQLRGGFSNEVARIRQLLINIIALVELTIDFSQEDVEFSSQEKILTDISDIKQILLKLIETAQKGMVLREGANVVICGRPNVGKSSLMNALLGHDRVIVTPLAGTTRDIIEESIVVSGIKIRLFDTAGIIETKDRVELEGIKRSKQKLAEADMVIFLVDASKSLSRKDIEIYETVKDRCCIVVVNKTDLPSKIKLKELREKFKQDILKISALKKRGLDKLEDKISEKLLGDEINLPQGIIVTNIRHKRFLETAVKSIERAMVSSGQKFSAEFISSDLNDAAYQLGMIIGESIDDDILDNIFSKFCIGK
ncbi:MAG: tRNA uridine-5-carboxymethylaminomethyl(34) synthesis GTPase MnmE [Candidatus Omnitrophota bacterium]